MVDFVSRKSENRTEEMEKLHSSWRKEGNIIGENYGGWSELYLIQGGKALMSQRLILMLILEARKVRSREDPLKDEQEQVEESSSTFKVCRYGGVRLTEWLGDGLKTI